MIIVNKVHFSFSQKIIFNDFSLKIPEQAISVLTGVNGVGKSTLLRLLIGNLMPVSGEIIYESLDSRIEKGNYGVLYSQLRFYPLLTVKENIELKKLEIKDFETFVLTDQKHILRELGLKEYLDLKASNLSKGNQMKLALALILLKNPQYLFLDEPTGNLDNQTIVELSNILINQCENQKTTILIASHDQFFIDRLKANIIEIRSN